MRNDDILIEVLADGTIKAATDKIGQANHMNAGQFLKEMARLAGGPSLEAKNPNAKHSHGHHEHEHEHEGHSH